MKTTPLDVKAARRRARRHARRNALIDAAGAGATYAEMPTAPTRAKKATTAPALEAFALTTMTPRLAHWILTQPRRLPPAGRERAEYENFINELRAQLQHLGVSTDGSVS